MAYDDRGPPAARHRRPLRTVAERCGYGSEFAFAKAFKREYGLAPGRYRQTV
ncbi:helix-turn-helix domain-containing protein [Nonomuraea antimicrobica]